jgi:hypothetical protein
MIANDAGVFVVSNLKQTRRLSVLCRSSAHTSKKTLEESKFTVSILINWTCIRTGYQTDIYLGSRGGSQYHCAGNKASRRQSLLDKPQTSTLITSIPKWQFMSCDASCFASATTCPWCNYRKMPFATLHLMQNEKWGNAHQGIVAVCYLF